MNNCAMRIGRLPLDDPQRCVLIEANATIDAVAGLVWAAVREPLVAGGNAQDGKTRMSARSPNRK